MSYRSPVKKSGDNPPVNSTKLYVGRLPPKTSWRDLEELFSKYGKIVDLVVKPSGCGFLQFEDPRDAEDAIRGLNDYIFEGSRLIVEFSRRANNSSSTCFICGKVGHWVRECPENTSGVLDVKSGKCFNCGEVGHLAKYCRRGSHKYSRSLSPRDRHYHRSRRSPRASSPPYARSRSPSLQRSPREHKYSVSPPPSRERKHSVSPPPSRERRYSVSPPPKRSHRYSSPSPQRDARRRSRSKERHRYSRSRS